MRSRGRIPGVNGALMMACGRPPRKRRAEAEGT